MTTHRKLPEGKVGRIVRLAGLGARAGAGLLMGRDAAHHAHLTADVLGTLRGLAAKVGQMASYVDGVVPEEHRDVYEGALGKLRAAAPTSSPLEIRRAIEEDLGAPIDRLFSRFDDVPLASASIGQVHRAALADGLEVAVKVQHPGIRRAVESDLDNAGLLEGLVGSLGARKLGSKRIIEEVRRRFLEELDYELEASRQTTFRELHAGDPDIVVPRVVASRSSSRVLTTELVTGVGLDDAARASEADRQAYCRTLWRFVFKGNLVGGMFNADPHPDNYVFLGGGRVAFLDFGCVQPLEGHRLDDARQIHAAALRRDEEAFRAAAKLVLETRGGHWEKVAGDYARLCFEPIFTSPFRMTRTYSAGLVRRLVGFRDEMSKLKEDFVPLPPGMLFMNRLQFGFYSVLARFDVEVDYAAVERAFLEPVVGELAPRGGASPHAAQK